MKRYKDYMDNLEVSDTLHQKLTELETPQKRPAAWRKYGAAAAALVLIAGAGAYGLSRGGWDAIAENFRPAAEVEPEIADAPAPYPAPDIASADDPYAPADRTNGGYELIDGEFASYFVLPYLEWADASALPQTSLDYTLAPFDSVQRDATWDDILLFMGGEKAMADHLLWDGLDCGGVIWFLEDGAPQAAALYAEGNALHLSLEVMKGGKVPSCIVVNDEYYETSQWQGVKITALKLSRIIVDGVELHENRVVSLYSNGTGYKLTLYADDADLADELCARFVRYAVDGGFQLDALQIDAFVPSYDPTYEDGIPDKGFPPEDMPAANILHPGDPGYVEPFPAPDGVPEEDSAPWTTPYNPNMAAEAKAPTPPN